MERNQVNNRRKEFPFDNWYKTKWKTEANARNQLENRKMGGKKLPCEKIAGKISTGKNVLRKNVTGTYCSGKNFTGKKEF